MKIVLIYILIRTDSISTSQRFHYHNGIWINTAGGNEMRLITEYEEMQRNERNGKKATTKTTKLCSSMGVHSVFDSHFVAASSPFWPMFFCQLKLIRAHEGWSWSLKKWIDSNFITIHAVTHRGVLISHASKHARTHYQHHFIRQPRKVRLPE